MLCKLYALVLLVQRRRPWGFTDTDADVDTGTNSASKIWTPGAIHHYTGPPGRPTLPLLRALQLWSIGIPLKLCL